MADNIQNISDITLNQNEYAFTVGNQQHYSSYINVSIPKLMPDLIQPGKEFFNRKIFANAERCMPVSTRQIETQDYITVKRSNQCSLSTKANDVGIIPHGVRVLCLCMNNNYRDMIIID